MEQSDTKYPSEEIPCDQRRLFILEKDYQRWSALVTEDDEEVLMEFEAGSVWDAQEGLFIAWQDWLIEELLDGRTVTVTVTVGDTTAEQTYQPKQNEDDT